MCVSPDYILIPEHKQDELVDALKAQYDSFFPAGSALRSNSFARIVSKAHFNRLKDLLSGTNGDICFGGKTNDDLQFEPTIVKNVTGDDSLMTE